MKPIIVSGLMFMTGAAMAQGLDSAPVVRANAVFTIPPAPPGIGNPLNYALAKGFQGGCIKGPAYVVPIGKDAYGQPKSELMIIQSWTPPSNGGLIPNSNFDQVCYQQTYTTGSVDSLVQSVRTEQVAFMKSVEETIQKNYKALMQDPEFRQILKEALAQEAAKAAQ